MYIQDKALAGVVPGSIEKDLIYLVNDVPLVGYEENNRKFGSNRQMRKGVLGSCDLYLIYAQQNPTDIKNIVPPRPE